MAKAAGGALLALAATVTLSGCGTMMNLVGRENCPPDHTPTGLSPDAQVYGGVQLNVGDLGYCLSPNRRIGSFRDETGWEERAKLAALSLIDLPLCAVGDTVTLPIAAYAQLRKHLADEDSPD